MGRKVHPRGVQARLVTVAQLIEQGLTDKQIRTRVANGYLHRVHQGVFLVGHPQMDRDTRYRAALLATGPRSFLSHRTAAAMLGLRAHNVRLVEVTVAGAGGRRRPGLTVHRTRQQPVRDELRTTNGLRHSSFARVLVELAPIETETELVRLVEEGVRRRLFIIDKVEAMLARHPRAPGIAALRAALALYVDRTDRASVLEAAFDRELSRRLPRLPVPERNVRIWAGGIEWEIDCLWREQRVIVELDGRPWHVCERDLEKDKLKDMKLAATGYLPVRVTGRRFERDADGVFADLETLVIARSAA
jgi:hypothetical protein